jgi:hypothetical protein
VLLTQVLTASVNAQEVLDSGDWLLENQNLQGDAVKTCMRVEFHQQKNGFLSFAAFSMNLRLASRNSSSAVSMRLIVSAPVFSISVCRRSPDSRRSARGSPRSGFPARIWGCGPRTPRSQKF